MAVTSSVGIAALVPSRPGGAPPTVSSAGPRPSLCSLPSPCSWSYRARLGLHPKYLLPGLETALLIALVIANPGRFNARRRLLRAGGLVMIGLVIAANAVSAALLISDLLHSRGPTTNAGSLLTSAGDIYLTNIIAFGLLYWELDRRGPVARAHADIAHPDFMFPQMTKWAIRITAVVLNDRCRAMGGRVALRQGFRATPASSVETCSSGGGWGP